MGPGTPAMTGVGRGVVQAIQDGRWIVLDCEQDQFLPDGTLVLKWQLHWVTGLSPEHGEYRAVMTDNDGHAELYRGRIDGDRLVFDSMEGAAPRLRFTWDVSDPALITWRNEMAVGDGSWCLIKAGADPKTRAVAPSRPRRKKWPRHGSGCSTPLTTVGAPVWWSGSGSAIHAVRRCCGALSSQSAS